jgi:membrane protease YdiL (CAAX protease family)
MESVKQSYELWMIVFCFVLPYLFLLPKVSEFLVQIFQKKFILQLTGFFLFATLPIFYDYLYNSLGWWILVRIAYSGFLFISFYSKTISSLPLAQPFLYLCLFFPLDLDILPGGTLLLGGGIPLKTVVMGTIPVVFYFQLLVFFLAVGIPEEMFFRVLFFFIWKKTFPKTSSFTLLLVSSVFFGLAHLITATPNHPAPNWAYCFLATLFGLMYGAIYMKTKQLFQAALVHALVDSIWLHWFML